MEFQDVVRRRRMVRNYADEPVDPAVVDRALRNASGRRAPASARAGRSWCSTPPEDVRRFWEATTDRRRRPRRTRWLRGMMRAPVVIVPCSSKAAYLTRYAEPDKGWTDRDEARWPVPFWHMDAAMASLLILQTAVDEGLGACFFGIPPEREPRRPRRRSAIPDDLRPGRRRSRSATGADDAGAAGLARRRRPRKPLDEVVHRGTW